ncbi:hypothetical protein BM1_06711 [Bipolaris maydis]|nr:hypothetical protein BM1_06711 [Bipolaris maydis]
MYVLAGAEPRESCSEMDLDPYGQKQEKEAKLIVGNCHANVWGHGTLPRMVETWRPREFTPQLPQGPTVPD